MIRLTKLTDYGIVLLTIMARDPEALMHNAPDLAATAHLPLPTVSKILKMLARRGILIAHRGAKGGFSLARLPREVSVAEIIDTFEGPIAMTDCNRHPPGQCELEASCPVGTHWHRINQAVERALSSISLAEMAHPVTYNFAAAHRPRIRRAA